uniref:TNFR-Cys domain-containing protein n=1 Tax=Haplochromis burtoni TaxID=8153 RepID=A0A3Q2WPJ4_HAPBU
MCRLSSQLIVPALVLLSGSLCGASVVDPVPTFDHRDPVTGEILKCRKCPPGTFMSAHCTATTPTQCQPCKNGHFTDLWNYLTCGNAPSCIEDAAVQQHLHAWGGRLCPSEMLFWPESFCLPPPALGPGASQNRAGLPDEFIQPLPLSCR